jgi:glycosyltransferase involved in cell wall biosynthesis
MKISIIFPFYNVESFIEESLNSILTQEFDKTHYEVILVNDGSTDKSREIVLKILSKSSIKYKLIETINKGLPSARNLGIKASNGDYLCWIDSDDIISSNHLTNLYSLAINNHSDVCFCDFEVVRPKNRIGNVHTTKNNNLFSNKELLNLMSLRKIKVHCSTLLIKKDFLLSNDLLFNPLFLYGEDVEFLVRLFSKSKSIGYINSKTYKYLVRENSLMTKQKVDKVLFFIKGLKELLDKLELIYPENYQSYRNFFVRTALGSINSYTKQVKEYNDYIQFLNVFNLSQYSNYIRNYPIFNVKLIFYFILNFKYIYFISLKIHTKFK